jgi:hypothetical protein
MQGLLSPSPSEFNQPVTATCHEIIYLEQKDKPRRETWFNSSLQILVLKNVLEAWWYRKEKETCENWEGHDDIPTNVATSGKSVSRYHGKQTEFPTLQHLCEYYHDTSHFLTLPSFPGKSPSYE